MRQGEEAFQRDRAVTLLTGVQDLGISGGDVQKVEEFQGGLFNLVLRIQTSKGVFFYKKFLPDSRSGLFQLPDIPSVFRAELAYSIQQFATTLSDYVPSIVATDHEDASFIMTAVPENRPLIHWMEEGNLDQLSLRPLFEFLARFHTETAKSSRLMDRFANLTFRDFKLGLQYEDIARTLPLHQARVVLRCEADYKKSHDCITYGDLNSRNVLVGESDYAIYMTDFDQAHLGTPAYDLAYILSEFLVSALYHKRPEIIQQMRDLLEIYFAGSFPSRREEIESQASNHLAVQIIYRFLGPSRQSWTYYIDEDSRSRILASATDLLAEEPKPLSLLLGEQIKKFD